MDIVIRRPAARDTFVDAVLPVTASPTDQQRWLLLSLLTAVKLRGTSLFTDADTLVYVDGEEKYTVGSSSNIEAIVEALFPEEADAASLYGDGQQ